MYNYNINGRQRHVETLANALNDNQKLFFRFLKEQGLYSVILREFGTIDNLRRRLPLRVREYPRVHRLVKYAEWERFAHTLIAEEIETERKRREEADKAYMKALEEAMLWRRKTKLGSNSFYDLDDDIYLTYNPYNPYGSGWYGMPITSNTLSNSVNYMMPQEYTFENHNDQSDNEDFTF